MTLIRALSKAYPWTATPLLVSAPLRLITLAPLAATVSKAGGIGFLAAGTDASSLESELSEAAKFLNHTPSPSNPLPVGIGFINWGSSLPMALSAVRKFTPAAAWLSFPRQLPELVDWVNQIRETSQRKTQVWVQIGTVTQAVEIAKLCKPDVIVAQGADAGGHGLARGAGIISLVPEIVDALRREGHAEIPVLAAGGISDGRGVAAALALGASGAVMGTRFLAAREAEIMKGYQDDVLRTSDGGVTTVRTTVYDTLRGTAGWPAQYDGRGIVNRSFEDAQRGVDVEENRRLYKEAEAKGDDGWGLEGRITAYAGTGVGLVREVKGAAEIVEEVRKDATDVLEKTRTVF